MCVWGQSRSCLLHPDLTCRLGHCPTSLYLSCYTINTFESRPRERPGTQGTQRRTRQRAALRELVNWCGVMLQVCDQLSSQEYKLSVHCLCAGSWGVQGRLMESPRPDSFQIFQKERVFSSRSSGIRQCQAVLRVSLWGQHPVLHQPQLLPSQDSAVFLDPQEAGCWFA